jgi:hypothetical protein
LYDWPIALGALARAKPGDPRVAERVELYVCGLELANGFSELTDAAEQRRRFGHDLAEKARLYGERYPIDPDFLAALEHGLPASAHGVGFDGSVRNGRRRIDDVQRRPWTRRADMKRITDVEGLSRRDCPAGPVAARHQVVALGGRAHAGRPGTYRPPTPPIRSRASSCRARPSSRNPRTSSTTRSGTRRTRRSRASPTAIRTACC